MAVYGTNEEHKLKLVKMGLTMNVVIQLEKDNQLKNIEIDSNNKWITNSEFKDYKDSVDDFFRFQLEKYL